MLDEETIAYLTQCTVCFVSEADIELANCGDQLCLTCLEQYTLHLTFRYVKWIVKMSLFNIKPVNVYCPICQFVDEDVVEAFEECLYKNRCVTKDCCGREQGYLLLAESLSDIDGMYEDDEDEWEDWKIALAQSARENSILKRNQQILTKLHSVSPSAFLEAQLEALDICPWVVCSYCFRHLCLRCGLSQDHTDCVSANHIDLNSSYRPCPRCWSWTERAADGCNEMQCEVCGKVFCWQCLRSWSNECGVYECRKMGKSESKVINKQGLEWEILEKFRK